MENETKYSIVFIIFIIIGSFVLIDSVNSITVTNETLQKYHTDEMNSFNDSVLKSAKYDKLYKEYDELISIGNKGIQNNNKKISNNNNKIKSYNKKIKNNNNKIKKINKQIKNSKKKLKSKKEKKLIAKLNKKLKTLKLNNKITINTITTLQLNNKLLTNENKQKNSAIILAKPLKNTYYNYKVQYTFDKLLHKDYALWVEACLNNTFITSMVNFNLADYPGDTYEEKKALFDSGYRLYDYTTHYKTVTYGDYFSNSLLSDGIYEDEPENFNSYLTIKDAMENFNFPS